jgi:hypothetical protein
MTALAIDDDASSPFGLWRAAEMLVALATRIGGLTR